MRDGATVAALRLTLDYLPRSVLDRAPGSESRGSAFLSRLVVHPDHRGLGLARALELAAIEASRGRGQSSLWAEASPTTAGPLQRLGFVAIDAYDETEAAFVCQHVVIVRKTL